MEITVAFYGSLGNLFGIISYQFADEFTETFTDIIKHKGSPTQKSKFVKIIFLNSDRNMCQAPVLG